MKYKMETIHESNILDGYSLSQVAKKTGYSPSYISKLRSGIRIAPYEVFLKIQKDLTVQSTDDNIAL